MAIRNIAAFIAVLLLLGCSGSGTSGLFQGFHGPIGSERKQAEVTPVHSSSKGMKLYELGEGGDLLSASATLAVTETTVTDGLLWTITDVDGSVRPIYLRVEHANSKWQAEEVSAGNWGGGGGLFAAIPTKSGSVDIGSAPINDASFDATSCKNAVVATVLFKLGNARGSSITPRDRTQGTGESASNHHATYPFKKHPADTGFLEPWKDKDNHVETFAPGTWYDRDKIDVTIADTNGKPYVLAPIMDSNGVETGKRLQFRPVLHGDYDFNGRVDIYDFTPIGANYNKVTRYDARKASNPSENSGKTNPYRQDKVLSNPPGPPAHEWVDGSMNGTIHESVFTGSNWDELQNVWKNPPTEPSNQLDSEVFSIASHYEEELDNYTIRVYRHGNPSDVYVPSSSVWQNTPRTVHRDPDNGINSVAYFSLLYDTCERNGMTDGSWDIEIIPVHNDGDPNDPEAQLAKIKLENAITVTGHPAQTADTTPPTFTNTPPGIISAAPYAPDYRSIWLTFGQAIDASPCSGVEAYYAYIRHERFTGETVPASTIVTPGQFDFRIQLSTDSFIASPPSYGAKITHSMILADYAEPLADAHWFPGARVGIVVLPANEDGLEPTPAQVLTTGINRVYTQVSYDETPPEWIGTQDYGDGISRPRDVIRTVYGSVPPATQGGSSRRGHLVYFGWADDDDTGISNYRLYYTTDTAIGDGATPDVFTSSEITSLTSTNNYIDFDKTPTTPFEEALFYKRAFFVSENSPQTRLWVLVTAYNGEGDPSLNDYAHDLSKMSNQTRFKRLTVSKNLDATFDSGDMAYKGWYNQQDRDMFIVYPTLNFISDTDPDVWTPNLQGKEYQVGQDPLKSQSWQDWPNSGQQQLKEPWLFFGSRLPWEPQIPKDQTVGIAPHSELSAEYLGTEARIMLQSYGQEWDPTDYDPEETATTRRNGYVTRIDVNANLDVSADYSLHGNYYDLVTSTYLSLPTDLSERALCLAFPWDSRSASHTVHAPTVLDAGLSYNYYSSDQTPQSVYALGDELKSGQLDILNLDHDRSILESSSRDLDYFFSPTSAPLTLTLWGIRDWLQETPPNANHLRSSLYLYTHRYEDVNVGCCRFQRHRVKVSV